MCALRIGVIGGGYWGRKHAEKVKILEGKGEKVKLTCVVDPQDEVRNLSRALECRYFSSFRDAVDCVDACIVAVPATLHYEITKLLLEEGKHVFVEKPIALTREEGETLLKTAEEKNLVLSVGHIEKLNPAFQKAKELLSNPMYVEGHRLSSFSSRGTDVDVVYDLMIHDIEILLSLIEKPARVVEAVGTKVLTDRIDIAKAVIKFDNGTFADLTASRVSMKKMRKLRFFERNLYLSIDFVTSSLEMVKKKDNLLVPYVYSFSPRDILLEEVREFVEQVQNGWKERATRNAVEAIGLAENILKRIYLNLENVGGS